MTTASRTLRAFWTDGPTGEPGRQLTREEALDVWADSRGTRGNFFGLTDDLGRTIQFYFCESIPDNVDDAGHLAIVDLDIPDPKRRGSFSRCVSIDEVAEHITKAFEVGVEREQFEPLTFARWDGSEPD